MKKNILYIGLVALALQSCDYLDREPLDSISKDKFFSTAGADGLQQYCNNLYPKLIKGHGDPQSYNFGMMEEDFKSDNIYTWEYNSISFGLHVAPTGAKDTEWNWENIRACNDFLANYEQSQASEAEKHRFAGEILFLKTLDYFNKVKTYGDVPWYDKVVNPGDEDLYKARDPRTLVADNMLRDIDQAIEWLPMKSKVDVTRISKDAALALKARFCLFEGTWRRYHKIEGDTKFLQEAYNAAGELMKSEYGYSLFQGSTLSQAYHELFIQSDYANNPEIILSKAYDPSLGKGNNLSRQIGVGETPLGVSKDCIDDYLCAETGLPVTLCNCPGHTTHTGLLAELNNRDPRLLQTVCSPEAGEHTYYLKGHPANIANIVNTGAGGSSSTGYSIAKFYNAAEHLAAHHQGTLDAPVFRFGEILLIRAEAAAELGTISQTDLDATVNKLRERVGFNHKLTMSPAVDPKLEAEYPNVSANNATLIREIRRERRVELFGEGYRFDDLRRWACGKRLDASVAPRMGMIPDATLYSAENITAMQNVLGTNSKGELDIYSKRVDTQARFEDPKNYLFAIPTNEISINPNLTQNTGW